jgi:NitT/TauT family transport system ATP-binding protein
MGRLRIDRLAKTYMIRAGLNTSSALEVFTDISLEVQDGEFVSLIGPSGCGKSTILNIVAGLDRATAGAVTVDDRQVTGPGLDRGVVFQEFALFPWLSVLDNISFGLRSMGLPGEERRRRAQRYVELVGLANFAGYHPNRLSGGMRQRVGIGRALAIEPAILLMDEPFGALDAQTREGMQQALTRIWQETKKTVLFITHDIGEAVYLSDRVLVMSPRPSRIVAELRIPLPHPRNRRNAEFQGYEERLEHALRGGGAEPANRAAAE